MPSAVVNFPGHYRDTVQAQMAKDSTVYLYSKSKYYILFSPKK